MGGGNLVPENTSKVISKSKCHMMTMRRCKQLSDPSITTPATDSSTDTNSVTAFTFDEIGLLAGVSTPTGMDRNKT